MMKTQTERRANRIGIVMPLGHQQGGAEMLLLHLLKQGSKHYELQCVFLKDGPLVEEAKNLGYKTFVTGTTRLSDVVNYLTTVCWLRRWISRENPDAILSWMPKAHLYVAPAAAFSGVKTLWYQHGITNQGMMDRLITALPANEIWCCSSTARAAQSQIPPARHISVCYPGVSFPATGPIPALEARARLGLDPQARIVGMVARLERWKGPHVFIEAAGYIEAACPGTYFFIVGGAHPRDLAYADEIQRMAVQSGLGNQLILAGQRPASEVPLWQASADLIVHPTAGDEPFGMAVVEAMGMGRVVVASDAGGPKEVIENGVDGFLVPKGDARKLADVIILLLRNPEERRRVEAKALVRGRSFSLPQFADRVDGLFREVLAQ